MAEVCVQHESTDTVTANGKLCAKQGCPKLSSYGREGCHKAVFCNDHKKAGMVDVRSKRCACHGCSKQPAFGSEGSRKAEFCTEHKKTGMVDVRNRRCAYSGCSKQPCFGGEGSRKAEFCHKHKRPRMVNVRSKRCAYRGCYKRPYFGSEGSRKLAVCSLHRTAGMVNVFERKCASEGCAKRANRGLDGSRRDTLLCSRHFIEMDRDQTSAVESAAGRGINDEIRERASEQVSLTNSRKREATVERSTRRMHQVSGNLGCGRSSGKRMRVLESEMHLSHEDSTPVKESSTSTSATRLLPVSSLHSGGKPREIPNRLRDDRAKSRERRKPTRAECAGKDARELVPPSRVGASNLANPMATQLVERTHTGEQNLIDAIRTRTEEGASRGDDGKMVETGQGDAFVTSSLAGVAKTIASTSNQGHRHAPVICAPLSADRQNWAALKHERPEAADKVKNLQKMVEQLKKQVSDAAVNKARAVAEATGKMEEKFTKNVQALRHDLGAKSELIKENENAFAALCDERQVLRQQLTNVQAQLASATSKMKTESTRALTDKENFQQRIKALRVELTAALLGWDSTKEDVQKIRKEREALSKEVQEAVTEGRRQREDMKKIRLERGALKKELQHVLLEKRRHCEDVKKILHERDGLRKEVQHAVLEGRRQCENVQNIRQERDALQKELEAHAAFHADIASKTAACSKVLADRVKSVRRERATTNETVRGIAPGLSIPASPGALVAAAARTQSSRGAPVTDLPTSASVQSSSNALNRAKGEKELRDSMGVCELEYQGLRAVAVRAQGLLDISMVAIKPEDEEPQAQKS